MSYLLDALKKAEQERENQQSQGVVLQPIALKSQAMPIWLVGLILMFVLFSVLVFISDDAPVTDAASVQSLAYKENAAQSQTVSERKITLPIDVALTQVDKPVVTKKIYELTELPSHVLAEIPSLSLQSHIYSEQIEYRSVILNDVSYKQNMFIGNQVVLNQITNQGIIIKVSDYLVFLPKGITWVATNHAK